MSLKLQLSVCHWSLPIMNSHGQTLDIESLALIPILGAHLLILKLHWICTTSSKGVKCTVSTTLQLASSTAMVRVDLIFQDLLYPLPHSTSKLASSTSNEIILSLTDTILGCPSSLKRTTTVNSYSQRITPLPSFITL